jgi:hypothetical protein
MPTSKPYWNICARRHGGAVAVRSLSELLQVLTTKVAGASVRDR